MANDNHADFTPTIPDSGITPEKATYVPVGSFKFWAQKVLPTVYDDSLSYYEVLTKLVWHINKMIEDMDNFNQSIENTNNAFNGLQVYVNSVKANLIETYNQLQGYVNSYFDNLDVQDEINQKLDEMARNGSLSNVVAPVVPPIVTAWLENHISPTSPAIDKSLTISDAGADAKVTGDLIRNIGGIIPITWVENEYVNYEDGTFASTSNFYRTDYIPVVGGGNIKFYSALFGGSSGYAFYDSNRQYISGDTSENGWQEYNITVPDNAFYFAYSCRKDYKEAEARQPYLVNAFPSSIYNSLRLNLIDAKNGIGNLLQNTWVADTYINYNYGTAITTANFYCTDFIPVIPGTIVSFYSALFGGLAGYAFYDINKNYITGDTWDSGWQEAKLNVPEKAYYFRYSCRKDFVQSEVRKPYLKTVTIFNMYPNTQKELSILNQQINSDLLVTWVEGELVHPDYGTFISSQNFCRTEYIKIMPGVNVSFYSALFGGIAGYAFYNNEYGYISGGTFDTGWKEYTVKAPDNAYYLVYSCRQDYYNTATRKPYLRSVTVKNIYPSVDKKLFDLDENALNVEINAYSAIYDALNTTEKIIKVGVQGRQLTQANAAKLSSYGYKCVRIGLPWVSGEREIGVYDFTELDSLVGYAESNDMTILMEICDYLTTPNMLYPYDPNNTMSTTDRVNAFVAYVTAMVNRYKNKNIIWEFWNEPDIIRYWIPQNETGISRFVSLSKKIYDVVHANDPTGVFATPALSDSGTVTTAYRWKSYIWFEKACELGLLESADYVTLHEYGGEPEAYLPDFVSRFKSVIYKYAKKAIPIIISETGYTTAPSYPNPDRLKTLVTEEVRAKYLPRKLLLYTMLGIESTYIYESWSTRADATNEQYWFGIFYGNDYTATTTAIAIKNILDIINGYKYIGRERSNEKDYILKFISGNTVKYACWTTRETHQVYIENNLITLNDTPIII